MTSAKSFTLLNQLNDLRRSNYYRKIFLQVESPPQQADVSIDALYSLVVSVKSSGDIHEVYIDAHFRNTALKVK